MRKVKVACPGFNFIGDLMQDFEGTLQKIADLGFDGIEFLGFFNKDAEEIKAACEKVGLEPFGCFPDIQNLAGKREKMEGVPEIFATLLCAKGNTLDEKLEYVKAIGCKYLGLTFSIPTAPTEEVLTDIRRLAEAAVQHGLGVYYHGHGHEFSNTLNGATWMDVILANAPDCLGVEPDIGWIGISGGDYMEFLKKWHDRIPVVHLKDYNRNGNVFDPSKKFKFAPTGYGVVDWAAVLSYCEKEIRPEWYVTDHDSAYDGDIYEEMKLSLDYVRTKLHYIHRDMDMDDTQ